MATADSRSPALSVVVPVFNEAENVEPLAEAVRAALADRDDWELLFVDDGSRDDTVAAIARARLAEPRIRLVKLARNFGQTAAMQAGFDHARGQAVVTMDGDLQNDPRDIPRLLDKLEEGYDLVAGYRVRRRDRLVSRKIPSWVANRMIARITGIRIRDNGCSLKAYRREVVDGIHLYSDMHRFIPAMAASTMGARIVEIPVSHHARQFGASKYGVGRLPLVAIDLLTIKMISSFRERPLALFGLGAMSAFALAILFAAAAIAALIRYWPGEAVAFVLPASALLWFGLGGYLLMLGLIAEVSVLLIHRGRGRRDPWVSRVGGALR